MNNVILFDWQKYGLTFLDQQDERKIIWIYDAEGG